jgi:hypothetical protein
MTFRLLGCLCAAVALTGCGGGVSATIRVGSLGSAASRATFRSFPTDAPQSGTAYSFAKVDGVRLTLTRLQAVQGQQERDLVTWSPARQIEVAPGATNAIAITEQASIPPGTYNGLKIRFQNAYSVKAYCRTTTKFVYTTATGVRVEPVGSVTSVPTDYDYYTYPFAAVTTATSATGPNPETMDETRGSFVITENSTPRLALLVDPSYLVSCYDGTVPNTNNTDRLAPFMWGNNNGLPNAAFFPDGTPNFGMGYVPMFISLSTDGTDALPTAEVYASSTSASEVADPIDFAKVNVTTFAFKPDGTLLDARARVSAQGMGAPLQQFFTPVSFDGTLFAFDNGEWICDAGFVNCRAIRDRSVTEFERGALGDTITAKIGDGPDCGKSGEFPGHPEWGNRYRTCTNSAPASLYFRRVPR